MGVYGKVSIEPRVRVEIGVKAHIEIAIVEGFPPNSTAIIRPSKGRICSASGRVE